MVVIKRPLRVSSDVAKDSLLFLLILLFEVCLYQFFFIEHYSSDSYTVLYDQMDLARNYSSTGRPLSALFVLLVDHFGINLIRYQIFFTALSIVILSFSVFYISRTALSLKKADSFYCRIFFTLSSVLIFNNIFALEHFVFSFQLPLFSIAMFLTALSVRIFNPSLTLKSFILYLMVVSAIGFIYQGFGGLFVPLALVCLLFDAGDSLKKYAASAGGVITAYFISLLFNGAYIRYVHPIFSSADYRNVNSVNFAKILDNAIYLIQKQYDVWITHCNMLPKYFFLSSVIASIILFFITQKEAVFRKLSTVVLITILLSSILISFVPHLISPSIGIAPRTIKGISALPGLIFFALLLMRAKDYSYGKEDVVIGATILICVAVLFVYSNKVAGDHVYTNRMDHEYAKLVVREIIAKERKSGSPVSKLSFMPDKIPTYCYDGAICYDYLNKSIRDVRWGFPFLLRMVSGRSFEVVEMDPAVYETFFRDRDWDGFDKEQVIVKNGTAYVVTY